MTASDSPQPGLALPILLAALSALGPFSIDTYLPSFPEIGHSLNASTLQVQQTLTFYLFAFSVMTLWHGAFSDRFGRRKVILTGVGIFALASVGAAMASSIEQLWVMRAIQGISAGAGMVVGRALVRDLYSGPAAQRLMSQIAIMFAVAPAIAPVIGGWLHLWWGWRAVFVFLALASAALWLACWLLLPETLAPEKRQSLQPSALLKAYREVLSSPVFVAACLTVACCFGGLFIYVLSAPVFLLQHLGLKEDQFFWMFGPAMAGMMTGSWLSGKTAEVWTRTQTLRYALSLMLCAALLNLAISQLLPPGLPWSLLPLPLYSLGMALVIPSMTLLALDLYPVRRGLAASCQSFIQMAFNSLLAGMIVPLLWGSPKTLALGMCLMLTLAAGSFWLVRRYHPATRTLP